MGITRKASLGVDPARTALRIGLAAVLTVFGVENLQTAVAESDTRTISFYNIHTKEDLTIVYKRNGRYDDAALNKINWILRDWRREEVVKMDPKLIDLVWEVHREIGSSEKIHIICGYRSPATNAMLRARSSGVADNSHHTRGWAIDFYIPNAPLAQLREIGLRMQRGGVGFYPSSGAPFVHMDVGTVRHWPRMTHDQLAKVFPDGRTVHVPSDGRPLAGYALAQADIERRGSSPSEPTVVASRSPGTMTLADAGPNVKQRSILQALFNSVSTDEEEDNRVAEITAPKPVTVRTAAAAPAPVPTPKPSARPAATVQLASAGIALPIPRPSERSIAKPKPAGVAVASANDVIKSRGYWVGVPEFDKTNPDGAMAYAAPERTGGTASARRPAQTQQAKAQPELTPQAVLASATTVAMKTAAVTDTERKPFAVVAPMNRIDNPWMRAMMVAPDTRRYMSAATFGAPDYTRLTPLMQKPEASVMMTFGEDPNFAGMTTERFAGEAVIFVETVTFVSRQTAALR